MTSLVCVLIYLYPVLFTLLHAQPAWMLIMLDYSPRKLSRVKPLTSFCLRTCNKAVNFLFVFRVITLLKVDGAFWDVKLGEFFFKSLNIMHISGRKFSVPMCVEKKPPKHAKYHFNKHEDFYCYIIYIHFWTNMQMFLYCTTSCIFVMILAKENITKALIMKSWKKFKEQLFKSLQEGCRVHHRLMEGEIVATVLWDVL